jgi:6-phosphogluconolactonase
MESGRPDVRISADAHELAERAAATVAAVVDEAVRRRGRCALVLSGGHTPRGVYEQLASTHRTGLPWSHLHVFWGDERYVAPGAPASNFRMAREALLDHVPIPPGHVHPMPTQASSPEAAAREYEELIRAEARDRHTAFDLVLLGLGEDGHTASLFPHSKALQETARWVVATTVPADPPTRLTLTLPALTSADRIFVLVSGSTKSRALARVLDPTSDAADYPAAALRSAGSRVTWWVDRDSAVDL